jgi:hypothetical protein
MLHGWENFFIVGATAGATLIGLLFVAITLGAGLSTPQGLDATRAFLTPTLVRFGGVLFECIPCCRFGRPRGRSGSFWGCSGMVPDYPTN